MRSVNIAPPYIFRVIITNQPVRLDASSNKPKYKFSKVTGYVSQHMNKNLKMTVAFIARPCRSFPPPLFPLNMEDKRITALISLFNQRERLAPISVSSVTNGYSSSLGNVISPLQHLQGWSIPLSFQTRSISHHRFLYKLQYRPLLSRCITATN